MNNKGKIRINLEKLIQELGLSKTEFSQKANMSMIQLNSYCNNTIKRLDVAVLARICCVLECSLEDLVEYEGDNAK